MDSNLAEARQVYVEAKINLRHAEDALKDAETAFVATLDYKELGSSNPIRDQAMAELLRIDEIIAKLRQAQRQAEDDADRAEVALEIALDERRAAEGTTWAQLADYLRGRVDHVGRESQAARTVIQESTGEILERQITEYQRRFGSGGAPMMEDDDLPF